MKIEFCSDSRAKIKNIKECEVNVFTLTLIVKVTLRLTVSQSVSLCFLSQNSDFVASYESEGHGGGIRFRLHAGRPAVSVPGI
jgi:hypothetical protein